MHFLTITKDGVIKIHSSFPSSSSNRCSYLVTEKADITLAKFLIDENSKKPKKISLQLAKKILFQLIFALFQGQESCFLEHGDLHFGNICLKATKPDKKHQIFCVNQQNFEFDSEWKVKLIDFGNSKTKKFLSKPTTSSSTTRSSGNVVVDQKDLRALETDIKRKLKIEFLENEREDEKQFRDLKKRMESTTPAELLLHPFFKNFKT